MMKKAAFVLPLWMSVLSCIQASAQIVDPVQWTFSVERGDDETATLVAAAQIEPKWHVYALKVSEDPNAVGPIPTSIRINKSADYETTGSVKEGKFITHFDPNFEMDLNYFENKAVFRQKIKIKTDKAFEVSGVLDYMACDDTRCIFPEPVEFKVKVTAKGAQETPAPESTPSGTPGESSGILEPVKWKTRVGKVSDSEYDIVFVASIDKGWHLYSQYLESQEGPIATSFAVTPHPAVEVIGKVSEGKPQKEYDPNFMMELSYFSDSATFVQRVKTKANVPDDVVVKVNFMCCNDEMCLPDKDVFFRVDLAGGKTVAFDPEAVRPFSDEPNRFQYKIPTIDINNPVSKDCGEVVVKPGSLWEIFILGFIGGLLALITPCLFPMIPLTVSFFTKGSQTRRQGFTRASTYGLFIFLIYVLLSLPFHLFDQVDENILNSISTNVWLNIFFFAIFIVFAFSFFGYYEITLPSSFANKMDNASNVGGLVGSFFMALTLAVVSFSCTGPILGVLLAGSLSSDAGAIQLTAGMGGFGLALGIPFAIFAAFPNMLKSLPKSGGWLNSVKVVLGFIELSLSLKFLSQADMVDHWNILRYELFIGLWILISVLMALYVFGKIKFPHDSPIKKLSKFRMGFGVLIVVWILYLASGFRYDEKHNTYHSLTLLSGLAPPVGYSWRFPKHCPHNLDCEHDYLLALERAQNENKPMLIDFTGYACVNCRKMEEHVWVKQEVLELLSKEFIVVSLYVDDREELPAELQETYTYTVNGMEKKKQIKTVGDRWAAFEIATFNSNAQPLYAIVSPDQKLLNSPMGYTPDVAKYYSWLKCGLDTFRSQK